MRDSEQFWDKTAAKYASSPVKDVTSYEKTLERVRAHLSPDDTVLEIGCGTGTTALLLADSAQHIIASDISSNMVDIAEGKARDQKVGNVAFVHATVFDETFRPESFDAVLAFNLLHLMEDAPEAVRRARALLKPGGLFISKTICLKQQITHWRFMIPVFKLFGLAPFVKSYTIAELDDLITAQDFEIVESGLYPASPASRFIVARKT